jgi:hypothetical protein
VNAVRQRRYTSTLLNGALVGVVTPIWVQFTLHPRLSVLISG